MRFNATRDYTFSYRKVVDMGSFQAAHSNTDQRKNSYFVRATGDWHHLSDDQMKASTLGDVKGLITNPSLTPYAMYKIKQLRLQLKTYALHL